MNFDYGNARLRAMKARLLTAEQLNVLATARNLSAFIAELSRTSYHHAADVAAARGADITVLTALLRIHIVETMGHIRAFYDGEAQTRVARLLEQYDTHNVKTILRGLEQHVSQDEIQTALIPVGELTSAVLSQMIRSNDVHAAVDTLASLGYSAAHPLLDLRARHPGAAVWEMELALERWYLLPERWPQDGSAMQRKREIDADLLNLMTMLRFAHAPVERTQMSDLLHIELTDLLVPVGQVPESKLIQIGSASSVADAIAMLENTAYATALDEGFQHYRSNHLLSSIERELRRYRLRQARASYVGDPLGIGVPIGYLAQKANEIGMVRAIAWGVHQGLGAAAIQQRVEFV